MSIWTIHDRILEKYTGTENTVVLPSDITEIGVGAFRGNTSIVKVIIPVGVKCIKATAFRECTKLEEVLLPEGLETIGAAAFYYCQSLRSAVIPATVKTLSSSAFRSCISLEKVVLFGDTKFEFLTSSLHPTDGIFNGCSTLKSAGPLNSGCNIEYGWKEEIPFGAFYGSALSEVKISNSIQRINRLSFRRCGSKLKVILPVNCELEEDVFDNDVNIHFSTPVSSKNKISVKLADFANRDFFEDLTEEEIAWLLLYQSKKWKEVTLSNLKGQRARDVLEKSYAILNGTPKVTKAIGMLLVDLLNKSNGNTSFIYDSQALKTFLIQKKCKEAADSINVDFERQKPLDKVEVSLPDFEKIELGDEITFGSFPQEIASKKSPIKWLVLAKEGNSIFLISKNSLAIRKYHNVRKKISWAKSDLWQWLNNDFFNDAFTDQEQAIIELVNNEKVTLLTRDDINHYFTDIIQLVSRFTEYACMTDPQKTPDSPCAWWLRMATGSNSKAPFVYGVNLEYVDASRSDFAQFIQSDLQVNSDLAVRPALWLRLG